MAGSRDRCLAPVPAEQEPHSSWLRACVGPSSCVLLLVTPVTELESELVLRYSGTITALPGEEHRTPLAPSVRTTSSECLLALSSGFFVFAAVQGHIGSPSPGIKPLAGGGGPTEISLGFRSGSLTSQTPRVPEDLGLLRWVQGPRGLPTPIAPHFLVEKK